MLDELETMETTTERTLEEYGQAARVASRELASASIDTRNEALERIADALEENCDKILAANKIDLENAHQAGLKEYYIERMTLSVDRVDQIATAVREVAQSEDPVGKTLESKTHENGMSIVRKSVPLGVIGVIFESRPNVTIDITALCLKSANAVILRGGSDVFNTNSAMIKIARKAITAAGLPADCAQLIHSTDRKLVAEMLKLDKYIDLMIPRGSEGLVNLVRDTATMAVIAGGVGVCHTYVDRAADLDMALNIVHNAKTQRHSVCNALDTVLIDQSVAPKFLPKLVAKLTQAGVELRLDQRAMSLIGPSKNDPKVKLAQDDDFGQEFLALILSVAIVDDMDDAIQFIDSYGSQHSEAIITADEDTANRFLLTVDSAAVFWNASIRFNDGGEFGLGSEVAVSTGKMHARGPVGTRDLTTYKWVVKGEGQIRT